MNIPIDEIHELAATIISPNHALFQDMLSEGHLGYLKHRSLSAAEKAMRDYLKKERNHYKHRDRFSVIDDLPESEDGEDEYIRISSIRVPITVLDRLPPREKSVLKLRLGLNGGDPFTEREAAEILNLPKTTVRRAYIRALQRLRDHLPQDIIP
ncbi:hypothetical protein LCGC14_1323850 [marine sediment metagenome]|uniref:RNA polymerase sigma-70 region 4 domain-containing protein n=1 Tax=marine sediment metagenome TaxID=412755 RepID=A0A0F9MZI4_9ZZZZ